MSNKHNQIKIILDHRLNIRFLLKTQTNSWPLFQETHMFIHIVMRLWNSKAPQTPLKTATSVIERIAEMKVKKRQLILISPPWYIFWTGLVIYIKYTHLNYVYSITSPYFVFTGPCESSGLDTERHTQTQVSIQQSCPGTVTIWFIITTKWSWRR